VQARAAISDYKGPSTLCVLITVGAAVGGATLFLCILSAACYFLRRRHLISTSDHASSHLPPVADVVNITIDAVSREEQERQRQHEEQQRAERQRQRQREEEEQKRQTKALSDQEIRWDKYCKSLSLSDLWESVGRSDQKLYNVNRKCPEFPFVEKLFMETMPNYQNSVITRVERVENGMLHDTYTLQRKNTAMDILKASGTVSCGTEDRFVKWLFHGTKQDTIDNIVNSQAAGYLPMLAGSAVGAIWGNGTYFARDAKYSHDYTEPKNDVRTRQSQRKMLLNRVIVGEWVKGAPGITKFPMAQGEKYRQCNSLVDDVDYPSIFVIQHSNQAYPAYVITYTSA
jgi:hypothetical protein